MTKRALITGITGQDGSYLADSKARRVLGWEPQYTFRELIKEMVASDVQSLASQL